MQISRLWMSLTGIFNSHLIMALAVEHFGTPAQKRQFLPRFASGELRGGLALTEPDGGTDLQAIRTAAPARRRRLRRQRHQDVDFERHPRPDLRAAGQDRPGRRAAPSRHEPVPRREGAGVHGQPQARKARLQGHRFGRAGVRRLPHPGRPADRRRGGAGACSTRSAGSNSAASTSRRAASGVARGGARRGGARTARCARPSASRSASTRRSRSKLADMATQVEASRLLVEQAARAYDRGERCDMEAGMAKLFASEAAVRISLEAMRIHGGYGYSKEFTVERLYRDAPLLVIGEGTNEMQRIIIARQLIKRNPVSWKPLEGVRILTIEQFGAGPLRLTVPVRPRRRGHQDRECGRPRADTGRHVGPHFLGARTTARMSFQTFGSNKKSITLDFKSAEGQEVFRRLTETGDAVMNNLRGDQPEKLGLDYREPERRQPGDRLPPHFGVWPRQRSARPGPATISSCRLKKGLMGVTGEPDAPRSGRSSMDRLHDRHGGDPRPLLCLVRAQKTGKGCDVDVSLFDVSVHAGLLHWAPGTSMGATYIPASRAARTSPSTRCGRARQGRLGSLCHVHEAGFLGGAGTAHRADLEPIAPKNVSAIISARRSQAPTGPAPWTTA